MSPFWWGFLATVLPIAIVSLVAAAMASQALWAAALLMWVAALFAGLVTLFINQSAGAGIFAGFGVGFVVVFTTCFPAFRDFQL